jgi:hypothetical protein
MNRAWRQKSFGTLTGWWATAARALALVLALAVALPAAGLAEDLAFHGAHPGHGGLELAMGTVSDAGQPVADPGLGCHVHCGCHVASGPAEPGLAPPPAASRPLDARRVQAVASICLDRLPRPPRA